MYLTSQQLVPWMKSSLWPLPVIRTPSFIMTGVGVFTLRVRSGVERSVTSGSGGPDPTKLSDYRHGWLAREVPRARVHLGIDGERPPPSPATRPAHMVRVKHGNLHQTRTPDHRGVKAGNFWGFHEPQILMWNPRIWGWNPRFEGRIPDFVDRMENIYGKFQYILMWYMYMEKYTGGILS